MVLRYGIIPSCTHGHTGIPSSEVISAHVRSDPKWLLYNNSHGQFDMCF